jgi:hypothetical protein
MHESEDPRVPIEASINSTSKCAMLSHNLQIICDLALQNKRFIVEGGSYSQLWYVVEGI